MNRIASLARVADEARNGRDFWLGLRDFLDGFYVSPRAAALADEPGRLAETLAEGARFDAYLGAVAEHLASQFRLSVPAWAGDPSRILKNPYFAFETYEGRMFLLVDSPAAFRARHIFVSSDALGRV